MANRDDGGGVDAVTPHPAEQASSLSVTSSSSASSSYVAGYDATFLEELDRKYVCPVCLSALRDPVQTKCGHRFCRLCLKNTYGRVRYARCPVDNTWFDTLKDFFTDNAVKREVLGLTVRCGNEAQGCVWTGELRHLQGHMMECPEASVTCPNGCRERCSRRHLADHIDSCPQRQVPCDYCHMEVVCADLPKHQLIVCPKLPVSCGVCGETGILRDEIPRHVDLLNGDCPYVTIKCAFYHLGCYFQDKRKNMASHYTSSNHQHMMLLCARMTLHDEKLHQHDRHLVDLMGKCSELIEATTNNNRSLTEQTGQIRLYDNRLQDVEARLSSGQLMWRLDLRDGWEEYNSAAIYTGRPGYKMSLRLHIPRDHPRRRAEDNRRTASLVPCIQEGIYDDRLAFPFDVTCHVTVFDQTDDADSLRHHHASTTWHQMARHDDSFATRARADRLSLLQTEELRYGRYNGLDGHAVILIQLSHLTSGEATTDNRA